MCWNAQVSFAFVALEASLLVLVWVLRPSCPYAPYVTLLLLTVIVVEFSEAMSWPHVVADIGDWDAQCPHLNTAFTQLAFTAITLQPLGVVLQAWRMPAGMEHPRKRELWLLALFAVVACCWCNVKLYTSSMTTCAYKGPNGHQVWRFADNWFFSPLVYIPPFTCFLFFYDKLEALLAGCGFFGSFVFCVFYFGYDEAGSTWCFTGVLIHIGYIIGPHLKAQYQIADVTSWSAMWTKRPFSKMSSESESSSELECSSPRKWPEPAMP